MLVTAVLFDLYDTLAYLRSDLIDAERREQARLAGVDADAWAGLWRANILDRMRGALGGLQDEFRVLLQGLGVDPSPALLDLLLEREHAVWNRAVTLYPEALPLLDELRRRGYRLGLVSNCSAQAGDVVRRNGLDARLDALTLSFEVGALKPSPEIFLHACTPARRSAWRRPSACSSRTAHSPSWTRPRRSGWSA